MASAVASSAGSSATIIACTTGYDALSVAEEHVLGAAQADAFGTGLRACRVLAGVGVGANVQLAPSRTDPIQDVLNVGRAVRSVLSSSGSFVDLASDTKPPVPSRR